MSSEEEPWYSEGLHFTCTSCGKCCRGPESGFVYMNDVESERLAQALDLDLPTFAKRYLRTVDGRVSLTEKASNNDCILWETHAGCQVYPDRPIQCSQFPFWPELLASREAWEKATGDCPGMSEPEARLYSQVEIEAILAGGGTQAGSKPCPLKLAE